MASKDREAGRDAYTGAFSRPKQRNRHGLGRTGERKMVAWLIAIPIVGVGLIVALIAVLSLGVSNTYDDLLVVTNCGAEYTAQVNSELADRLKSDEPGVLINVMVIDVNGAVVGDLLVPVPSDTSQPLELLIPVSDQAEVASCRHELVES